MRTRGGETQAQGILVQSRQQASKHLGRLDAAGKKQRNKVDFSEIRSPVHFYQYSANEMDMRFAQLLTAFEFQVLK